MVQNSKNPNALVTWLRILKRRWWLLLLCLAAAVGAAIAYNQKITPLYRATAKVIFEDDSRLMDGNFSKFNKEQFILNQIEEMKTGSFALLVYEALPEDISQVALLPEPGPAQLDTATEKIRTIEKNLASKPARGTEIVDIYFDSKDPMLAQGIVNTAASVLIKRNLATRRQKFSTTKNFLDDQFEIVKTRLQGAELDLKSFKERRKITSVEDESREILQRATQAEILYNEVSNDIEEKLERLTALNIQLNKERENLTKDVVKTSTPYAAKLKERLVDLEVTYSGLQVQGVPVNNPKMIELRNETEQIKQSLVHETMQINENLVSLLDPFTNIRKSLEESIALEMELQGLQAKERNLRSSMASYDATLRTLPEAEMTLLRLMRDREVNNKMYLTLIEEREKARIQEASEIGNIRIIESARLPELPYRPNKMLNLVISVFVGFNFGIFLVLVAEYFRDEIKTVEDVERALGFPVIATIPKLKHNLDLLMDNNGAFRKGSINESILVDEYNLLYYAMAQKIQKPAALLVTSFLPNEGKSTTATMVALTSAQRGMKTLLVDGDLRRPTIHSIFNTHREPGLTNLALEFIQMAKGHDSAGGNGLVAERTLRSALLTGMIPTFEKNLLLLPSGFIPANPVKAWSLNAWYRIIAQLKSLVDLVVIDAPPIIGIADTTIMSSYVDHILLCVELNKMDANSFQQSFKMFRNALKNADQKIVGIMVNKVDRKSEYGRYKYYRYYAQEDKKSDKKLKTKKNELPRFDFINHEYTL